MYEAFYGLTSKPFQLNPDPTFYFGSKQHSRARAYLEYGISRHEGFVVITGDIGAGKTTLVLSMIDAMHGTNVTIGHLVTTQLGAEDMLRMVGAAFGFQVSDVPKSALLVTLEAFLLNQTSQGKRCLLIVDEAQNLTPRAVEELRMLSNFQYGSQALLQSVMVGQPEFRDILQRPEMEQFRQRVTATCHIGPLALDEAQHYIEHRLKCAGATDKPTFDAEAYTGIFEASRGIPRRINLLCDRLLLLGFLGNKVHFGAAEVADVVKDLAQETQFPTMSPPPAIGALTDDTHTELNGLGVDIDLSRIRLDPALAKRMSRQLVALEAEPGLPHLQRLEACALRNERLNLQILATLRRLIDAVKSEPTEGGK